MSQKEQPQGSKIKKLFQEAVASFGSMTGSLPGPVRESTGALYELASNAIKSLKPKK